jgi:hypothetical protein
MDPTKNSLLQIIYVRHHELVDRYQIPISQMPIHVYIFSPLRKSFL